ncbi:unnamed protein product [Diatraea saccharalis]|uniref:Uncharacterized protein n=1 Tax=Diatraea saccharalis TaxID=40085 RepID=A0A9N9QXV2_9NEOP|nr:unnamed protein product [Diatraea saccharalis]
MSDRLRTPHNRSRHGNVDRSRSRPRRRDSNREPRGQSPGCRSYRRNNDRRSRSRTRTPSASRDGGFIMQQTLNSILTKLNALENNNILSNNTHNRECVVQTGSVVTCAQDLPEMTADRAVLMRRRFDDIECTLVLVGGHADSMPLSFVQTRGLDASVLRADMRTLCLCPTCGHADSMPLSYVRTCGLYASVLRADTRTRCLCLTCRHADSMPLFCVEIRGLNASVSFIGWNRHSSKAPTTTSPLLDRRGHQTTGQHCQAYRDLIGLRSSRSRGQLHVRRGRISTLSHYKLATTPNSYIRSAHVTNGSLAGWRSDCEHCSCRDLFVWYIT